MKKEAKFIATKIVNLEKHIEDQRSYSNLHKSKGLQFRLKKNEEDLQLLKNILKVLLASD